MIRRHMPEPSIQHLNPRNILIIKPSSLGDIVHALPVPRLLKQRWPQTTITWLVNDAFADLLSAQSSIDEVLSFDRSGFAGAWFNPVAAGGLVRFSQELADRRFDLVIDLQGLFRSGWLSYRTGAASRIGLSDARELAAVFYTDIIHSDRLKEHAVDRYLHVARELGCRGPAVFDLRASDAAAGTVREMLRDCGPYAVLMPATNWPTKRWPPSRFAALVGPLRERFGMASVIAGSHDAAALADQIPGAVSLAGRTTLSQLVSLLAGAELVIANDSGPMHIAAALGRPLVAIYGATDPLLTGPWRRLDSVIRLDIPCAPCLSRRCSHRSCLEWLDEADVLTVAGCQLARIPRTTTYATSVISSASPAPIG
jgi:heptosyltransferase I